jgi:hypothetical protein
MRVEALEIRAYTTWSSKLDFTWLGVIRALVSTNTVATEAMDGRSDHVNRASPSRDFVFLKRVEMDLAS